MDLVLSSMFLRSRMNFKTQLLTIRDPKQMDTQLISALLSGSPMSKIHSSLLPPMDESREQWKFNEMKCSLMLHTILCRTRHIIDMVHLSGCNGQILQYSKKQVPQRRFCCCVPGGFSLWWADPFLSLPPLLVVLEVNDVLLEWWSPLNKTNHTMDTKP